jgi:hypothetical protein
MFTNVSWADYLVVVALILSAYYLTIWFLFYSHNLKGYLSRIHQESMQANSSRGFTNPAAEPDSPGFTNMEAEAFPSQGADVQQADDRLQEVERLVTQLKEAIAEVKAKKYSKEEFILLLQLVLKDYPAFKNSPFESAIQDLIILECKNQDSISLTPEDIRHLFKEAPG